jgi:acetolactate synthase-1/2/3 large subunit/5-guanidino-2-oxopentanoate decarboxylase
MAALGVEIAAMLAERGVDTVFGIPGVHNVEMYRGIEQSGISHILARHEQGAGFMADGYARATGKPGVAFVISGPGLTNILTPMGQAYSDSVPMLVISSVLDETSARRGQLHQMRDQEGAARTVSDWSETARTAQAAYALIDRALTEFQTDRPRPKHIQIPISVLGSETPPPPPPPQLLPPAPAADPALIADIAARLKAARKPLFLFGGGATRTAPETIARLIKSTGAASFTTYAGRGLVAADAPVHYGSTLANPGSAQVIAQADCIVAAGTELAETDLWRDDTGATVPLIRIDIDPECLTGAVLAIRADAARTLDSLADALAGHDPHTGWSAADTARARARFRSETDATHPGVLPVADALRAALPKNTRIFSDMTQFAYASKELWDMPAPRRWHHPYGFGTLGYALPAAIGAAMAGGPVLAIAGDYGLQYTLQELGTAAEHGLPLPILLWDNNALGQIRDCMVEAQIAPNAVTLKNPNWHALAEAYDCAYAAPPGIEALCRTVVDAFSADRPTIIRATPSLAG